MAKKHLSYTFESKIKDFDGQRIVRESYRQGVQLLEVNFNGDNIILSTPKYMDELNKYIDITQYCNEEDIYDCTCCDILYELVPYVQHKKGTNGIEFHLGLQLVERPVGKKVRYTFGMKNLGISSEELHEMLIEKKYKNEKRRTHVEGFKL